MWFLAFVLHLYIKASALPPTQEVWVAFKQEGSLLETGLWTDDQKEVPQAFPTENHTPFLIICIFIA